MKMLTMLVLAAAPWAPAARAEEPAKTVDAVLTFAPAVPPPTGRAAPAVVRVALETREVKGTLMEGLEKDSEYEFWTFNGRVPGPFIRVREGDTLDLTLTNPAASSMAHNIDLHAVTGPGGGAAVTLAKPGESRQARFKMLTPGLYVYHCAAPPVTDHIANGMYGLILVEPAAGLPKADKEYYVMQSEFYTKEELGTEGPVAFDREKAAAEKPTFVVFNGRHGGLLEERALSAKAGETVRLYFGNAGPNLTSSFHVIGAIFDRVWREGALSGEPARGVQTTVVPAGGSSVVEFPVLVPGAYTLVDHSIFRIEKGAMGALNVTGPAAPDVYRPVK